MNIRALNQRRRMVAALGITALLRPLPGIGQPAGRIRRVGILYLSSSALTAQFTESIKQGMRDHGWVEGSQVEYVVRHGGGQSERVDAAAADLVAQNVEVIFAGSTAMARSAQKATQTIPIVMLNISNPVENKFIATLARPGGNITGLANQFETTLEKLFEALHEMAPRAQRMALLVNEANPSHQAFWAVAQRACAILKLTPLRFAANAPNQLEPAIAGMVREKAQAIVVVADPMYLNERKKLDELVRATKLPAAYGLREHVVEGGLLSYAVDLQSSYRYAAVYASKILRGAKPADLPVEQPARFSMVVNLKTARSLNLKLPDSIRVRADEVIE